MRRLDGKRFRWFLQVGRVELAQVPRHALIDLCQAALHLRAREVLVAVVDRFELAAVHCDAGLRQQTDHSAKGDKLRTHLADRRSVILAEIGNRLVIGSQPTGEPHDFNVAPRITSNPTARLNSVEITEDVELQQHRRMIRGPPGGLRINPFEPKLRQIEPLNKTSITRTGLSSQIQSSRHSGNSVICWRSTPSMKRLIPIPPQIAQESYRQNQIGRAFLHNQDPERTLTLHAYHLARSKLRMLRVIPLSGQFGITRHGDNTFNRSPSSLKNRVCSEPTHSGFQATSTLVIHLPPSTR